MNKINITFNGILGLLVAFATVFIMSFCSKDYTDWGKLRRAEIADRNAYLASHNITVEPKESGLYYIETEKGKGLKPTEGRTIKVNYKGTLLNGKVFDEGDTTTFIFKKNTLTEGFYEGVSYMRKGGKATLIVPSSLAYGPHGNPPSIPKYSTLIFEIELLNVQ